MNAETFKALQGSIEKWERIVDCEDRDHGTNNCPLCIKFYRFTLHSDPNVRCCLDCPISIKTGQKYCYKSPYEKWDLYMRNENEQNIHVDGLHVFDQKSYNLALAELEFLKSLLPENTE